MSSLNTNDNSTALPMRPCVGVVLFNRDGRVWMGKHRPKWASAKAGIAAAGSETVWQLPQGGIEPLEPSRDAAFRELWEETGVTNATLLGEIPTWLTYRLPPELMGIALKGRYAGHRLRWYAMRFDGDDGEIDITPKGGASKPEFEEWRWVPLSEVPALAISYRRPVYEEVAREFARFGSPAAMAVAAE